MRSSTFATLDTLHFSSAPRFVAKVERWLAREQRIIEIASGEPLVRAYFVRLGDDDRIVEVLASGSDELISEKY